MLAHPHEEIDMAETVGQRVDRLEEALMKLAYAQFNNEMGLKELREENLKFQREMAEFKDEMRAFKNEMAEFKNEMAEFKRKVDEDIAEMKRERREMNLQWGAIANKLGTIVEDIIYPSCRRIAREHFGAPDELEFEGQRIRRPRMRGDRREFDGILVWEGHVMLLEAKATVRPEYLEAFHRFVREEMFFRYFPEYAGRRLIPIFSSLSLTDEEVAWLTERRLYAVAMGEEAMALLNPDCPLDRADAR